MTSASIFPASVPQPSPRQGGEASPLCSTVPRQTVLGVTRAGDNDVRSYRDTGTSLLFCSQVTVDQQPL